MGGNFGDFLQGLGTGALESLQRQELQRQAVQLRASSGVVEDLLKMSETEPERALNILSTPEGKKLSTRILGKEGFGLLQAKARATASSPEYQFGKRIQQGVQDITERQVQIGKTAETFRPVTEEQAIQGAAAPGAILGVPAARAVVPSKTESQRKLEAFTGLPAEQMALAPIPSAVSAAQLAGARTQAEQNRALKEREHQQKLAQQAQENVFKRQQILSEQGRTFSASFPASQANQIEVPPGFRVELIGTDQAVVVEDKRIPVEFGIEFNKLARAAGYADPAKVPPNTAAQIYEKIRSDDISAGVTKNIAAEKARQQFELGLDVSKVSPRLGENTWDPSTGQRISPQTSYSDTREAIKSKQFKAVSPDISQDLDSLRGTIPFMNVARDNLAKIYGPGGPYQTFSTAHSGKTGRAFESAWQQFITQNPDLLKADAALKALEVPLARGMLGDKGAVSDKMQEGMGKLIPTLRGGLPSTREQAQALVDLWGEMANEKVKVFLGKEASFPEIRPWVPSAKKPAAAAPTKPLSQFVLTLSDGTQWDMGSQENLDEAKKRLGGQ